MKYVYIFWLNAFVIGFESVLDKDTVVEGEPFTIRCSHRHVNATVTCQTFDMIEIYKNHEVILTYKGGNSFPHIYYPKDGNWFSMCSLENPSNSSHCTILVKHARMDHQGLYDCYFIAQGTNNSHLCKYYGSSTLKVIKAPDVTTSPKTTETQSSSDVRGSRQSEKRFSTTLSPSVTNTTDLQVTDESLDLSLKVLIASATFFAMLGEASFFTIAWVFWRKAKAMAVIRKLFQNPDEPGPKTAISHNPTNDITPLGSDITDRFNQTTPDAVLDQHSDLHSQPISRTELVDLSAQKTPGQELIDRTDLMSGASSFNSFHQ